MKNSKLAFIKSLLLLMLITVMALSGCDSNGSTNNDDSEDIQEIGGLGTDQDGSIELFPNIGVGELSFLFEVVNDEDMSYFWVVHTNKPTVGEALLELDLIRGDESDFGFFVYEINGLVADFDNDGTFWAFFIDGEFAMTGVMDTEIEPDTIYGFVFTEG